MSIKSTLVSGQKCRSFVQELKPFHNSGSNRRHPKGSTLWGVQYGELYVVYSYGQHWPLYINWEGIWFSNNDKSPSPTTTRHRTHANPYVPTLPVPGYNMKHIIELGYPVRELLFRAADLKLVPEHLIAGVTALRVGVVA